jgi:5-methylcytosine-specific restriction endonuclease McrA
MPKRVALWVPPRPSHKIKRAESRPNSYQRGYCDSRHFAWRKAVLLRDNYICCDCRRLCSQKSQAHADHVIPVKLRPDLRYVVENGACRCHSCHSRKTVRENGG